MTFLIRTITRALLRRDRGLRIKPQRWRELIGELDRRGGRLHEAGAFLLGDRTGDLRKVTDVVFYDELDPNAYDTGVCVLRAPAFAALWSICRERGVTVVGDVHTHGGSAGQSEADRTNPMVAREGHIAIIVPNFAARLPDNAKLGLFEYRGRPCVDELLREDRPVLPTQRLLEPLPMTTDPDKLHRTAKYFMDDGRAATAVDAMEMLSRFGLTIIIDAQASATRDGQIALLTLVNASRRTMLGGVEVKGVGDRPALTALTTAPTLRAALEELGGTCVDDVRQDWPKALIGSGEAPTGTTPSWRLQWAGWRGGVTPAAWPVTVAGDAIPLAPALAAAACVGEVFAWHAGDHAMAGHRASGLSAWRPGAEWTMPDGTEPALRYLPTNLWMIGLGNLGQAFSWVLASLPFPRGAGTMLMLQDFDSMGISNDSTSLLAVPDQPTVMKTRWVGAWLEARGFQVRMEERRFGAWTRRTPPEPGAALCGVDNTLARAALEDAGFDLVVEAGLGAGTQGFRNFSLHAFPGPKRAGAIWGAANAAAPDVSGMPAYLDMERKGVDRCGLAQIASRSIGVPFVGLTAAILAIGELLRRLHGAKRWRSCQGRCKPWRMS